MTQEVIEQTIRLQQHTNNLQLLNLALIFVANALILLSALTIRKATRINREWSRTNAEWSENPYRFRAPAGWNNITEAPRDGTVIEIQNNYGIAPTYSICKWVSGRGWQNAVNESSGVSDGPHLSWRPYVGAVDSYIDPTGGAQETREYWDRAIIQASGGP